MVTLGWVSFLVWCWLLTGHGQFWRSAPEIPVGAPAGTPAVAVVVPARNEAPLIEPVISSLLAQNYAGPFRIWLIDDNSEDGTASIAARPGDDRLRIVPGQPRPAGWAGKLWAVHQGLIATGVLSRLAGSGLRPEYVLLTDADIVHDPSHLASLVAKAEREGLDLVSEMVALSCASWPEKALIPAFVFFFQLLYPFAWVNNPLRSAAAAAGGTVLIHRRALHRIGGIQAVRGALIDDVALAAAVKPGGRIFLGHSRLARSIRPYDEAADIWRMITRSAYAQLRFSPALLAATVLGMAVVWLVPPWLALFGNGWSHVLGAVTWVMLSAAYCPTLTRLNRSWIWSPALPLIAAFYTAATIASAINHHRGRSVAWKGRVYAGGLR